MPFLWEGIRVERDEGIFGAMLLQAEVESYKAGKIICVRYESRPDYFRSACASTMCALMSLPFLESVAFPLFAIV